MDYKDLYKKAFSSVREAYPCSDHETALKNVIERAKKMEKRKETRHRIIGVAGGIAGAAAVLAGAVFGLKWLNDNGGLKGPDVQGGAASGGNSAYTADIPQTAEKIDISELAGRTFTFSDMTATVDYAGYDGQFIRYDVTETWSGETEAGNSAFVLEPASYYGFKDKSPASGLTGFPIEKVGDKTRKAVYIEEYSMATGNSLDFYPASYSNERNIERITDLIITAHKERDTVIWQAIPDDSDELGDGIELQYLWVSPQVLELKVGYEDYDLVVKDPVVFAISADGTAVKLRGNSVGVEVRPDHSEIIDSYYISDDPQLDLSEMKAFEINDRMFEITEKAAEFTTATAITTAPLTTATDEEADTTAPADPIGDEIRNVSAMLDNVTAVRDALLEEKKTLSAMIAETEERLDVVKQDIIKTDELIKADASGAESEEYNALAQDKLEAENRQKDLEGELDRLNERLAGTENSINLYEKEISDLEEMLAELNRQITGS